MEGWRQALAQIEYAEHTDVYEFGVFTGKSIKYINDALSHVGKDIRKIFGFDSFCGLPKETEDERDEVISEVGIYQWREGDFDSQRHFGVSGVDKVVDSVNSFVRESVPESVDIEWIAGFYSDSLQDNIVKELDMQPASYVDLDADLYLSTIEALDFMFRNDLIQKGTVIGYDDGGGTPRWNTQEDGASKAHVEMCEKYNVDMQLLAKMGDSYPHVQTLFLVNSIG